MPLDDINRKVWREPNPQTMSELRQLAHAWRAGQRVVKELRANLDDGVVKAFDNGHSYRQIKEATGLSTSTIAMILARAGLI